MAEKLNSQDILRLDGYLEPFIPAIERRQMQFQQWKNVIFEHEGGYEKFTKGYGVMGFTVKENGTIVYREWAPNAQEANLIGDFSLFKISADAPFTLKHFADQWNRLSHPMSKNQYGVWEVMLPPSAPNKPAIAHDSKVKVSATRSSVLRTDNLCFVELDIHDPTQWYSN